MSAVGEVVYLVTVRDHKSYVTMNRVFSDKETAEKEMYQAIMKANINLNYNRLTDDEVNEAKEQYLTTLHSTMVKSERESSTIYTTKVDMVVGAKTEAIDVIQGQIMEVVIE